MQLNKIIELLEAVALNNSLSFDSHIDWACATDLMSEVLYYSHTNSILLTGLAKAQAIRTAEIADIKVIAFTRGKEPDAETIKLAKEKGITLLITPLSLFTASGRLFGSGLKCCPDGR